MSYSDDTLLPDRVCANATVHDPHNWHSPRKNNDWHCPGVIGQVGPVVDALSIGFANRPDKNESWNDWRDRNQPERALLETEEEFAARLAKSYQTADKPLLQAGLYNPKAEEVDHPSYYGGDVTYEPIKVAIAWAEMFKLHFLILWAIKYLVRNGGKPGEDGRKDLRKAVFYIKAEFARRYPGEEL